ncbi:DUF805 domain-containing protein [Zobellella sp. DQSA1]|uniref:DUF805 domain-containing protein n=1 Tax=Zobellella sp. DQSA1 TaxID=3342386 RepID=UPI0035C24F09
MKWYWQAWQRSLVFSGRASRRAFWMFFLVNLLVSVALVALEMGRGTPAWVEMVYSIVSCVPLVAVTVRRLHDTGRSGGWAAIFFVPVIGVIVLLLLLAQHSDPRTNLYDMAS